ncbi:MAG: phosphoribosylanthranilate isomerase [Chloroflexi bacterium]|nr:phosphoribosylanthranilate isomerase [Chloroflexota bacterium]
MMRFKICGLRDVDSALVAADAGAEFLGFAFVHGVRRQLTLEQGRDIIPHVADEFGENRPGLVGLFADQDIEEVNRIIEACGLDYAQLCGSEEPDYWDRVEAKVFKQIKVKPLASEQETVESVLAQVNEVVSRDGIAHLDAYKKGAFGGTGHTFDWSIAARVAQEHDVVLAGGLSPDNVATAIRQADPWMVDVSSGVETDGVKDHAKIHAFADAVRSAT